MMDGKRVRLEADPQADEVDKYGRLLRNVILEDGTDFNAKLVADGYAYAYVSFPQNAKRKTQLKNLQAEAQTAQRGLWDPKTCDGKK
jgi:micrococcal nuclease